MTTLLTYAEFLGVFLGPPIALLLLSRRDYGAALLMGSAVLCIVGVLYTAPSGSLLAGRGVRVYGDGAVLGRVFLVPVEEYAFMVLQTVLTALWVALVRSRRTTAAGDTVDTGMTASEDSWAGLSWRTRIAGAAVALAVGLFGAAMLSTESTLYMGAILAWASPVLAVQWAFGWPHLWRNRRLVATAVGVPTVYLAAADRVAIELGIWVISSRYTTGILVGGLPIEEGAFFFLTNVFVVQGLLLYLWVVDPATASTGSARGQSTSNRRSGGTSP